MAGNYGSRRNTDLALFVLAAFSNLIPQQTRIACVWQRVWEKKCVSTRTREVPKENSCQKNSFSNSFKTQLIWNPPPLGCSKDIMNIILTSKSELHYNIFRALKPNSCVINVEWDTGSATPTKSQDTLSMGENSNACCHTHAILVCCGCA